MKRARRFAGILAAMTMTVALATAAPAAEFDLRTAGVADVQAAVDAGALSYERLVELLLARIKAYDQAGPRINAVITVNPRARETARALDAELRERGRRGPLHGIPVLLKDNYDTADLPTTGASRALAGSLPPDDAFTVARLRAAGAIVLAKVNLSELARSGVSISSLLGQTLNPYDLGRTPGGSSGGTGAGIAAGFGIVGTGSDTGQSTRSPASANALVGIRPSYGLVSRDGIIPISWTHDTAGPITRTVRDAALMLDVMAGFDPADRSTWSGVGHQPKSYADGLDPDALRGARIGVISNVFGDGSHPEHAVVTAVTNQAILAMRRAGATVFPVDIPAVAGAMTESPPMTVSDFETVWIMDEYFASLGPRGKYHTLAQYVAAAGKTHPPVIKALRAAVARGGGVLRDPEYALRLQRQAVFRDTLVHTMDELKLDALFYPHQRRLVVPATKDPDQVERNGFLAANTGLPAITVPGGFSPATAAAPVGVPIGVEFLGRSFSEAQLIRIAYAFEQQTHFRLPPESTPTLPGERFTY
jgi:Asp-tRNA(Asn)/Glu-tRNA(Gln) amidotransferase A subunit family amidase